MSPSAAPRPPAPLADETPAAPAPVPEELPAARAVVTPGARTGGRLAALDGIRFIAALSVVLFHFVHPNQALWGKRLFVHASTYSGYGQFGVDLFFIVSGFVICMSAWGRSLGDFAVSRAVRLYPMYWAALAVTAFLMYYHGLYTPKMTVGNLLTNATLFQRPLYIGDATPVTWSLWFEIHFYLLFSLVVRRGLTYRRVLLFAVVWLVASALVEPLGGQKEWVVVLFDPQFAPYFVAGMCFYLMYRFRPTLLLWLIVAGTWLRMQYEVLRPVGGRVHWNSWDPSTWGLLVALTICYLLVAAVALGWTSRIRWRWLTTAGAMTYPLYLLHLPVGDVAIRYLRVRWHTNPYLLLGVVVAGLCVLAYACQRWFEAPVSRWMRRELKKSMKDVTASA